jgi:hypothetical protein
VNVVVAEVEIGPDAAGVLFAQARASAAMRCSAAAGSAVLEQTEL